VHDCTKYTLSSSGRSSIKWNCINGADIPRKISLNQKLTVVTGYIKTYQRYHIRELLQIQTLSQLRPSSFCPHHSIRPTGASLPTIAVRYRKALRWGKHCRHPTKIVSREGIRPSTSSRWVEQLAKPVDIKRSTAVRIGDTGDATVVGGGGVSADNIEGSHEIESVNTIAVDLVDHVVGSAGSVEGCLWRGDCYCRCGTGLALAVKH